MSKKYKDKYDKMANKPVKGLVISLAVPTVLTMLVSALYNMADSFFVGKLDTASVASIGIVFSIMTLLQAVGFFLGNGSGVLISTLLGEKKREQATVYANVSFFTAILSGILLALAGILFSDKISLLLGATATTAESCSEYLKYILIASPFILGSFVLNNQLRYQGSAVYSMLGIISGSILNIIIDPIFIFTFKLGVKGAAIATAISQLVGFIILLYATRKNENLKISVKYFKPSRVIYVNIAKNGLASLARQGIQTAANISLNYACSAYGDSVTAGMSVFNRVTFFGFAIVIGLGQGFQPVCSFNNGAKNYKRVYDAYIFTVIISSVIITIYGITAFIYAPQLISLFRNESEVVAVGSKALRYECLILPLTGFCTASNMLMQSMKKPIKATVLALARQGIFYLPLIFILPRLLQVNGILTAQPIADLLSFVITIILALPTIIQLKKSSNNSSKKE